MVSIRFLIASIALLAVPLASAAPEPAETAIPEPVQVSGCFAGGITVIILDDVELRCVGAPPATATATGAVEQCGNIAYQVTVGPAQTSCITVVEVYACPGGGGYLVVLDKVQVGECRPCCEPVPATAAAEADQPVEVRQCDHWGNSVVLFGKIESPCITTGCSPTCATAAEAAAPFTIHYCMNGARVEVHVLGLNHDTGCIPVCNIHCEAAEGSAETGAAADPHFRTCSYHPRGVQLYNGEKAIGPCILLPEASATAGAPGLWHMDECAEGEGTRFYVLDNQVTECGPAPVTVDMHCNKPHGVQVYVAGEPATRCVPLPHGV